MTLHDPEVKFAALLRVLFSTCILKRKLLGSRVVVCVPVYTMPPHVFFVRRTRE